MGNIILTASRGNNQAPLGRFVEQMVIELRWQINAAALWEGEEVRNLQFGDVANGGVVVGAVALDGWVDVGVVVDVGGVDGDAAAGFAADVPRRRRLQPPSPQDRVQRRHCTIARTRKYNTW